MISKKPYLSIIVKPTYNCNLSCKYCSVGSRPQNTHMMSFETVDMIFKRATEYCGTHRMISLIWHGGEPLLLGPDFYDYIGRKTQEYSNFNIINSIQTNATLINNDFIKIISKYKYKLSTSLDGPSELHDKFRKDKNNSPTFDTVFKSISLLKASGIQIGAITVLNKTNKDYMPDIYKFFSKNKIHFRINPVQLHGNALKNNHEVYISPNEYGEEMIRIFDMWYHDTDTNIIVDPFRIIIGNIVTGHIQSCDFRNQCHGEVISIGPDGDIYPCGQFNGYENYYLGDIHKNALEEVFNSPDMKKLLMRIPNNIPLCSKCRYVDLCNCGCTASAVCRNGNIMEPDFYCTGRQMLFQHILDTIKNDLHRVSKLNNKIL